MREKTGFAQDIKDRDEMKSKHEPKKEKQ